VSVSKPHPAYRLCMSSRRPPLDPEAFRRLPESIDVDDTVVSVDADPVPVEPDDGIDAWLLKKTAG
jgi:hypothetical protein